MNFMRRAGIAHRPWVILLCAKVEFWRKPKCHIPKGAKGTMQVMDATIPILDMVLASTRQFGRKTSQGRKDYLGMLFGRYGGNVPVARGCLYAGPGAVDRALNSDASLLFGKTTKKNSENTWGSRGHTFASTVDLSRMSTPDLAALAGVTVGHLPSQEAAPTQAAQPIALLLLRPSTTRQSHYYNVH